MGKRYFDCLLRSLGYAAICVFCYSFLFASAFTIRTVQILIAGIAIVQSFAFFVFELKLFSQKLWVRRAIVLVVGFAICVLLFVIFGEIRFTGPWWYYLITLGIVFVIAGIISAVIYYISDKMYQKSLNDINRELQKNEGEDQ